MWKFVVVPAGPEYTDVEQYSFEGSETEVMAAFAQWRESAWDEPKTGVVTDSSGAVVFAA